MPDEKQQSSVDLSTDSPPSIQQIVERYLSNVEWTEGTRGRCTCPGKHKHTHKSHRNDCWVFINGVPTVTCLHQSCENEVAGVNDKIRTAWSLYQPPTDPVLLAAATAKAAKRHELEDRARSSLPEVLKQFKWDIDDIAHEDDHGSCLHKSATEIFLKSLFAADETIWIGEPETTGRPEFWSHFTTRQNWEIGGATTWHYTCASTFKPGTYSRANINVATTPYLIVEGDKVLGKEPETDNEKLENKNACGAIFNWLRSSVNLKLRAVVDSGNKSLHGWFDMPSLAQYEQLKIVLPAMGCDRAMFKPTQPARLPGVMRDNGNEQKLLWLNQ